MRPILCATPGCQDPRCEDQPYCVNHRQEVKPRGRPVSEHPRNVRVRVQVTAEEHARLQRAAALEGVPVPVLIRMHLTEILYGIEEASQSHSVEGTQSRCENAEP